MYRLNWVERLQLRSRLPNRRRIIVMRRERIRLHAANESWRTDFVSNQLSDGTRYRTRTVLDVFSKQAIATEVGQRLGGEHVVAALNRLAA
jgi:putative transposase